MRNYKWQVSGLLVASIAATLLSTSAVAAINYSFTGSSGQTVTGSSFWAAGGGWSLISHLSNVSNVSSNSASITGSTSFITGASPVFHLTG